VPGETGWAKLTAVSTQAAAEPLDDRDKRLIAALQCDGRLTAERAAAVLGLSTRAVHRRWAALLSDGAVRVLAARPQAGLVGVMVLRIRVLRGELDAVTAALAARADVPVLDVSAGGDEISAILLGGGPRNRLVFQQLPATSAVTSVDAQTILHVFSDASDWRLDVLTDAERAELTPVVEAVVPPRPLDEVDEQIIDALSVDGRLPAAAISARTGHPESTVRRRLASLFAQRRVLTQAVVDPQRLGLAVDATISLQVPPDRLDAAGRTLAAHPAVHGAFATTGAGNLRIAVWLRDTEHLYRFLTEDLTGLSILSTETMLVGQAVKRPGKPLY
jgi:DNA-binding Lrp family transcriptional regulator